MLLWKAISSRISPGSWFQTIATNSGRIKQDKKGCLGSSDSPEKLENHIDKTGRNRGSEVARATAETHCPCPRTPRTTAMLLPLSLRLQVISSRSKSKLEHPVDLPMPGLQGGWRESTRPFLSPLLASTGVSSQEVSRSHVLLGSQMAEPLHSSDVNNLTNAEKVTLEAPSKNSYQMRERPPC